MNKQGRHSKRELENLGAMFINTDATGEEVEIRWKTRYGYDSLRVYITNQGTKIIVARPGLGGTFNLSYDYLLNFKPSKGFDFILDWIKTSENGARYMGAEYWNKTVASMIDVARVMVHDAYKRNDWHFR